jgi:hypothetical protein
MCVLGPAATTAMQTIGGGQRAMREAQANTEGKVAFL